MAQLAKGALRKKRESLALALDADIAEHHRFLLQMQLERLEQVEATIARLDERITEKLVPYAAHYERLLQIPGVDRVGAAVIIAELGVDMTVFPTVQHAAAWAGVCPGNRESAGKHKRSAHRRGNVHLTTALVQAAMSASKRKGSYLKEKYWRLKARRGGKRAAVAIAHRILVAAYHMLRDNRDDRDLGPEYLDKRSRSNIAKTLVRRLEHLGYDVHLNARVAPLTTQGAVPAA